MNYLINTSTDPYFNMAFDEYCLKAFSEHLPLFYIWRNRPSVILGCNQCVEQELDLEYCRTHDIDIVRRCSGGGMVYHDLGNVNFSFIGDANNLHFVDYAKSKLIEALTQLGINAVTTARNDLFIDGKKFSGTAVRMTESAVLFHGTLLFDVDLEQIRKVSNKLTGKIARKAIESRPSDVANLSHYINNVRDVEDFMKALQSFLNLYDGKLIDLLPEQIQEINELADTKYRKHDWIYQL